MFTIYCLKLERNKYYVGKTYNLDKRIKTHKNCYGSHWTALYKYVETVETIQTDNHFYEDMMVKKYMNEYGIENVRGGSYSQIYLSQAKKELLQQEIYGANNNCFKCGGSNHFVKDCNMKNNDDVDEAYDYIVDISDRMLRSSIRKTKRLINYFWK